MAKLSRNFLKGVMNKDVDERLLADGQYRDALNIDAITSEGSDAGTVRNIAGNREVADLGNAAGEPAVNARTIGAVTSDIDNIIYWFVTSDNYDGIYEYNETTGDSNRILQSSTGQLNFSKDYIITGLNYIDGFLYWTDDLNPPRKINISTVREWTVSDPRIDDYISVIVAPPLRAPSIEMLLPSDESTNMEDKFLQFATRYKYSDDQYSALSPFSPTAFIPGDYVFNFASGNNEAMVNTKNKVNITFETGGRFVEEVHLFFRDSTSLNVKRIEKFNKETLGINNNTSYQFIFKNSKEYSVLADSQVTRLYDNVPLKAKAQDVVGRRLAYGNYVQGFDITDCSGVDVGIDYTVDYVSEEVANGTPIQTFRSDRDYEIGIVYCDDYGRTTTVLTTPIVNGEDNNNNIYIPPTASDTGNSLVVKIKHKAPCFATNYRLVLKESKRNYYNVFPVLYYADGTYRYFLINKSDIDKFSIGEYLIFKSNASGVTYSNKKYKILDVESKPTNFLGGSQVSGIYFKINDDDNDFSPSALTTYYSLGKGSAGAFKNPDNIFDDIYCYRDTRAAINPGTEFKMIEPPIFYGQGLDGLSISMVTAIDSSGSATGGYDYFDTFEARDMRVEIQIETSTTFKYRIHQDVGPFAAFNPGWIGNPIPISTIPQGLAISINSNQTGIPFNIVFSQSSGYTVGDRWIINCRGEEIDLSYAVTQSNPGLNWIEGLGYHSGVAISNLGDIQIQTGAIVTITIAATNVGGVSGQAQVFPPSSRAYENIEEWFYEEGASGTIINYEGASPSNTGSSRMYFRRGSNYEQKYASPNPGYLADSITQRGMDEQVRMMITGQGITQYNTCTNAHIQVAWRVDQLDNSLLAETEPKSIDTEIFHELGRTMPIIGNDHQVMWRYLDYTSASGVWGNETWYASLPSNQTNIGMLSPSGDPSVTDMPHTYIAGDIIYVNNDSTILGPPTGEYEVLYVPNAYNVIINAPFTAAGPSTGGGACFYSVDEITVEQNQVGITTPAIIKINHPQTRNSYYNAYAFGNGLESNRIRDDFNETMLEQSIRASVIIDGYKEERKEASICYSGVYRNNSSINRLNEFNLSIGNYKNLDVEFGSIQKMHARDTDLVVLQEDKISNVLNQKNILKDAAGGGQVSSVNAVLGTQVPFPGEYGISTNPESFAEWGGNMFFTDERRGSVIKIENGQIGDISELWMKDHFRDLFSSAPKTQKLGVYDPYKQQYIIASNNNPSLACRLSLRENYANYPSETSGGIYVNNNKPDIIVLSNTSWTVSIVYSGGSDWVTGYPSSGFGDESIYLGIADNISNFSRTAIIKFTYCDTSYVEFTITQAVGNSLTVTPLLSYNGNFKKF